MFRRALSVAACGCAARAGFPAAACCSLPAKQKGVAGTNACCPPVPLPTPACPLCRTSMVWPLTQHRGGWRRAHGPQARPLAARRALLSSSSLRCLSSSSSSEISDLQLLGDDIAYFAAKRQTGVSLRTLTQTGRGELIHLAPHSDFPAMQRMLFQVSPPPPPGRLREGLTWIALAFPCCWRRAGGHVPAPRAARAACASRAGPGWHPTPQCAQEYP